MLNIKSVSQIVSEICPKQVLGMKRAPPGDETVISFSVGPKESLCQI